jgi:hypothetical protein
MSEQTEPLKPGRNLVRDLPQIRSPHFLEAYSNNVGLAANFYDITLHFGKVTVSPEGKPVVENTAAVTMSWEHAKALVAGLNHAIQDYEKDHLTKIRTTPSDSPKVV